MVLATYNSENGTAGETVTAVNSGWFGGATTKTAGAVLRYSIAQAAHGTKSIEVAAPATTDTAFLDRVFTACPAVAGRYYLRLTAYPSAETALIQFRASDGTLSGTIGIRPAGTIHVFQKGGNVLASSTALALDTWYRIDARAKIGAGTTDGTLACQVHVLDTTTSPLLNYTGTAVSAGTVNYDRLRFAKPQAAGTFAAFYIDDFAVDDTRESFIGPFFEPLAVTATASPASVNVGSAITLNATATGGSGTKAYAWTSASGPAGTFADPTSASTTFTPSEAGTAVLRCTVTDATGPTSGDTAAVTVTSATQTLTFPTVELVSGVTAVGATGQVAASDSDDATYLEFVSGGIVDYTLPRIQPPTGDLTGSLRASRVDSTSGSFTVTLRDGTTTVATATVSPSAVGTAIAAHTYTFAAASISTVTSAKWDAGTLRVRQVATVS